MNQRVVDEMTIDNVLGEADSVYPTVRLERHSQKPNQVRIRIHQHYR